jgi:hypothetical protein
MDGQLTNLPAVKHELLRFKVFCVEMVAWPHTAMLERLVAIVHHLGVTTMAGATRMKIVAVVIVVETLAARRPQTATIMDIVIGTRTVPAPIVARTITDALTGACAAMSRYVDK